MRKVDSDHPAWALENSHAELSVNTPLVLSSRILSSHSLEYSKYSLAFNSDQDLLRWSQARYHISALTSRLLLYRSWVLDPAP